MSYRLLVRPLHGKSYRFPLDKDFVTIGRSARNDLVLDDHWLSRFHMEIRFGNNTYFIHDLDSRNGTAVNGVRLRGKVALHTGDVVALGDHTLTFDEDTLSGRVVLIESVVEKEVAGTAALPVTLSGWGKGDPEALDRLLPVVYKELQRLAQSYLSRERPTHTLQATALVNEAYLRLVDEEHRHVENRSQFFAVVAQAMRRTLIDHARRRRSEKRGGGVAPVTLDEGKGVPEEAVDVLTLDLALRELSEVNPRQAQLVELKYFGGLSIEETATVLGISAATVAREWKLARAWLRLQLGRE